MNIEQVKVLAAKGESQQLEYKKSTSNLKDIFQTICAFLNGDGGIVLIGIEDTGKLVGQDVSDKTKREIGLEMGKIAPFSDSAIEVFYLSFTSNRQLIIFHVTTDSTKKPYTYNGRAYVRLQTDTLPMPLEHYQQLMLGNEQFIDPWEDVPLEDINIEQMNTEEIITTIHEGVLNGRVPEGYETQDPIKALTRLGLINKQRMTRAALILFGKNPEIKFPQCILRLARFKGTDKSEFLDNKQISGNVFHLLRSALAFANLHLPIASTFSKDSIQREDKPLFPITILREAITNALCHRDYSYIGGSVSFAIYDNRLEIWSYGLLPPGLLIDTLGELNQSIPRNRRISNVLYYHKLFESWGRGVRLIMDGCIAAGHPQPIYSINSGGLLLTMPLSVTSHLRASEKLSDIAFTLTDRQQEILKIVKKTAELSTKEIHNLLVFPPSERWLRDQLNGLKRAGYLDSKGQTTAKKWFIKS
jgi:ATP-dependent DNA helicase RecG